MKPAQVDHDAPLEPLASLQAPGFIPGSAQLAVANCPFSVANKMLSLFLRRPVPLNACGFSQPCFAPLARASRRGNAVLEAALVLPILLSLAFGTIEFGHFYFIKHNLQGAARQGARAAIPAGATNNDVIKAVGNVLTAAGLQPSTVAIATTPPDITAAAPGDDITVTVQCKWGSVGVRPLTLISANKPVKAAAVMRKEGT
ncbi:MAG: TadE/TadG family type IV pilus assembly protein [Bacillota bacterium]